ncbi:MAG: ABC transporter permease [Chloroflexi bacterium]|nr:ABC transporter permease [Chloroflexota bacterium]
MRQATTVGTLEVLALGDRGLGARLLRRVGRFARRQPLGFIGAVIIALLMFVAAGAPLIAPSPPDEISTDRLVGPGQRGHLLGTDSLGRDVFSRVIYGARVSITVGFLAVGLSTTLAVVIGVTSGYAGGWADAIVQRFVDALMAFPGLVLLVALVAVFGPGITQLVLILGVVGSAGNARVFRSAVLAIRSNAYLEACVGLGASPLRVIVRHVLPNIFAPMMISVTVALGGIILAEAGLSFLGLGVPPPAASWGNMLSVDGRRFMLTAPWLAIVPGIAITLVVFAFNMLGDALRDVLDPRLRGRR